MRPDLAPVVGVREAARLAGTHEHTVRRAFRDRRLLGWTVSGVLLIDRASLDAWRPRAAGRPSTGRPSRSRKLAPGETLLPPPEGDPVG